MGMFDLFVDPIGTIERIQNADERQNEQWQTANSALAAAGQALETQNYDGAVAAALTGLLALQLSRT